jgi:hypothetical protein
MDQNDIDDIDNFEKSLKNTSIKTIKQYKIISKPLTIITQNPYIQQNNFSIIRQRQVFAPSDIIYSQTNSLTNTQPIGDVALEQALATLNKQTSQLIPITLNTSQYKKDYILIDVADPITRIIQYGIFTLFFNTITYVITTTTKQDLDYMIITCSTIVPNSTTISDPTQIVDMVYKYQTNKDRTLFQKSIMRQLNNPEKLLSTLTITSVDPILMNLNIVIKNGTYLSTTDFNTLNSIITILMAF